MKKIYTLLSFVLLFSYANAQFPAPYCAEAYSTSVEPITSVVFGSTTNTSSATVGGNAHEDYTSIVINAVTGATYNVELQGNTDGAYTDYFTVFVDWNGDGDFLDADERFNIGSINNSTGTDGIKAIGTVTVPGSANVGSTRMRVVKKYAAYQSAPCNTSGYGEAEDYTINVQTAANCSGTPTAGTITGTVLACNGSAVNLSLLGATIGTGIGYQWQITTVGGSTWTNIANATTSNLSTLQGLTSADYRCILTCSFSSQTANTPAYTVTLSNSPACPPVNDEACAAITLLLDGASDCQNTTNATSNNDPPFNCSTPNNTTWYKFTPATTDTFLIKISAPASGDTLNGWLGIYTATGTCASGGLTFTNVTATVLGACKSFLGGSDSVTNILAGLDANTEYYFMIDGVLGATGGYCIAVKTRPVLPASCVTNVLPASGATGVSAPRTTFRWNTIAGATSYDFYGGTTNPPTGLVGSYAGDSVVLTGLAFSTTYYWYVVPRNAGGALVGCDVNATSFTTDVAPSAPANDDCIGAVALSNAVSYTGTTISATQSQASESCNGSGTGTADDDVWFMFTTGPNGGDATIDQGVVSGSNFDGVIIAYSGSCGSFTQIGCADNTTGGPESVTLTNLAGNTTYYFRIYSYDNNANQDQFTVKISGTALPVNIIKFAAAKDGGNNILNWTTTCEVNNKGFEVQKSANGNEFVTTTFVASKAINGSCATATNYSATDAKPYMGTSYYRLKQIDHNGKFVFSNIIAVKGDKINKLTVSDVYPNPATKVLNLVIASPFNVKANISITDVTGKVVASINNNLTEGNNNIQLNVADLSKGAYLLKVVCGNDCSSNIVKFVK